MYYIKCLIFTPICAIFFSRVHLVLSPWFLVSLGFLQWPRPVQGYVMYCVVEVKQAWEIMQYWQYLLLFGIIAVEEFLQPVRQSADLRRLVLALGCHGVGVLTNRSYSSRRHLSPQVTHLSE